MATTYSFIISIPYDINILSNNIQNSTIIGQLDSISLNSINLSITFTSSISIDDQTILNTLVTTNSLIQSQNIALGINAGTSQIQGQNNIAIGTQVGSTGQNNISIGTQAGSNNQGQYAQAYGFQAGYSGQGQYAQAYGFQAGQQNQGNYTISDGFQAGQLNQGMNAIAIGYQAGQIGQGTYTIAIGVQAGQTGQSDYAQAYGYQSGYSGQDWYSLAIGYKAGQYNQGSGSIAKGYLAGQYGQSSNAIAIGTQAGQTGQGINTIAIGYLAGQTGQNDNSIVLNASGEFITAGNTGTFIDPIRQLTGPTGSTYALNYSTTTREIVYSNSLSGIDYGSFYFSNVATTTLPGTGFTQTITSNVWNIVISNSVNIIPGLLNNFSFTAGNGTTTAPRLRNFRSGIFLINFIISMRTVTTASQTIAGAIFINGVIAPNIISQAAAPTVASQSYLIAGNGIVSLTANSTIDLRINASGTSTATPIYRYSINIIKIT